MQAFNATDNMTKLYKITPNNLIFSNFIFQSTHAVKRYLLHVLHNITFSHALRVCKSASMKKYSAMVFLAGLMVDAYICCTYVPISLLSGSCAVKALHAINGKRFRMLHSTFPICFACLSNNCIA